MRWFSHRRSRAREDRSRQNRTQPAVNVHCRHPRRPHNGVVCCCVQRTAYNARVALPCIVNGDDFRFLSPMTLTFDPKFEFGWDFCTVHLTAKFHHPMFNGSEVIVLTNKQTNKLTNKQTPLTTPRSAMLRRWVKMSLCRHSIGPTHVINCTAARLQPHIDIYEITNIFRISWQLDNFCWGKILLYPFEYAPGKSSPQTRIACNRMWILESYQSVYIRLTQVDNSWLPALKFLKFANFTLFLKLVKFVKFAKKFLVLIFRFA